MKRSIRFVASMAICTLTCGLAGCSGPATKLFMPSREEQITLGQKAAEQQKKESKLVTGAPLERVNRVAQRLVNALPDKNRNWPFSFQVVEDKEYNAFALPGGPIYVNTGLLDRVKTDDELAGVIGHEMVHVWDQHWAKQYAALSEKQTGISILISATKSSDTTADIAGVLTGLSTLKYSRKEEDAADKGGLETMVAAGYDPQGMVRMFETMATVAKSGGLPEFLRSHPDTDSRIRKTKERIAKMGK
jgi:predicted Zn-dependent protease